MGGTQTWTHLPSPPCLSRFRGWVLGHCLQPCVWAGVGGRDPNTLCPPVLCKCGWWVPRCCPYHYAVTGMADGYTDILPLPLSFSRFHLFILVILFESACESPGHAWPDSPDMYDLENVCVQCSSQCNDLQPRGKVLGEHPVGRAKVGQLKHFQH